MDQKQNLSAKDREIQQLKRKIELMQREGLKLIPEIDRGKPLAMLTVGDLLDILEQIELQKADQQKQIPRIGKYAHGIKGICEIFGCKPTKANEIKASGIIDKAITQHGRSIAIDVELALKLAKQ